MTVIKRIKLKKKIKKKETFRRKMRSFLLMVIFFFFGLCIIEPILENTVMEELNSFTAADKFVSEKVPEKYIPLFSPAVHFFSNTAFGKLIVEIFLKVLWLVLGFLVGRIIY